MSIHITIAMFTHRGADMTLEVAQACINIAAALGAMSGPLVIGALTKADIENGWRTFYVRPTAHCSPSPLI